MPHRRGMRPAVVETGMIAEWNRISQTAYALNIDRPGGWVPLYIYAEIRPSDKLWHLYIQGNHVAAFGTFEELDGVVPVLANGYLTRTEA